MEIGITATRHGITAQQGRKLQALLTVYWFPGNVLRHGDCVGGDEAAFEIGTGLGYYTIAYPATNVTERLQANTKSTERIEGYETLARNKIIVEKTAMLVAMTQGFKEIPRSGTWTTIRYAQQKDRPIWVITPDGLAVFKPCKAHDKYGSLNWSDS